MNLRDASKNGLENFFGQALEKRFIWENCFCTTFTAVLSPPSIIPHHLKSVASPSSYYELCDKHNTHNNSYLVTSILHISFVVKHLLFNNDVWSHPSQVLWVSKIQLLEYSKTSPSSSSPSPSRSGDPPLSREPSVASWIRWCQNDREKI